jgi:hypothetical protein
MTLAKGNRTASAMAIVFGFLLAASPLAHAQQEQDWMIKASEEHKILQKDVGTWDAVVKVWPMEGAQAMESKGTETNELLPGGLWLVTRFEGEVIGIPFVGTGASGYDPKEKKYISTWADTMTPYLMITKSDYDKETRTMTGIAETRDPYTGEQHNLKIVARYNDDDTRTMEMHRTGEGGWKVMEIQYKRKK